MGFRYIGSKDKLSQIIISEIRQINKNAKRVVDLMAGTGLFSLALREEGFQVCAVDVMTYSYHHLNVHLFLAQEPEFVGIPSIKNIDKYNPYNLFDASNYDIILNYLNRLSPLKGYFYDEFSPDGKPTNTTRPRKYFTAENASKIDAIRVEIKSLRANGLINEIEHSLLLHDLIMAANDIANIAGTYGHYLSKFIRRSEDPITLSRSQFSTVGRTSEHTVLRGYAEELARELSGDICYIDPPYIKRQYAANYHILETLAREDNPEAIGDSGLRPWRDQYSNFCSKIKIWDSFDKILSVIACPDILISYSEDGLVPIDELVRFFEKYGTVSKKDIRYKRFKSNDSKKSAALNEYLIHIRKH